MGSDDGNTSHASILHPHGADALRANDGGPPMPWSVTVVTVHTLLDLLTRTVASVLGAVWSGSVWTVSGPAGTLALVGVAGAIGLVAVVALASLRSVAALAASLTSRVVWSRPAEPPAGWLVESVADPDADGHPRPRAPGLALRTA
jgi:hypothetical protein